MRKVLLILMLLSLLGISVQAEVISLIASDGYGTSSFNSGLNWSDGLAPSAGNDYVTGDYRLRTPADGGSYTFGGDSLTVNNTNGYTASLMYKGTGSTGSITIDNLIMDGGMISHAQGGSDIFNLYGQMTIASGGAQLYSKQGPINIYSTISGSGEIFLPTSDWSECKVWIRSSTNTFTGNIVNESRLGLVDDAVMNFVIGASGVNNYYDGTNHMHVTLDGDFVFDLTGAGTTLGDSWTIVNATTAATYYGGTFTVAGFHNINNGVGNLWNGEANGVVYQFNETLGTLSVVPEPATLALLGLGGLLLRRRK